AISPDPSPSTRVVRGSEHPRSRASIGQRIHVCTQGDIILSEITIRVKNFLVLRTSSIVFFFTVVSAPHLYYCEGSETWLEKGKKKVENSAERETKCRQGIDKAPTDSDFSGPVTDDIIWDVFNLSFILAKCYIKDILGDAVL
ncbi:hypothetical protein KI387_012984, partial [Taxus chinensis]